MNPNCDASPQLEDVIWKCIAKDPAVRFASMDEVLAALKRTGTGALTGTMMGATGEYAQMQGSGLFGTTGSGPHTSSSGSGPQQVMSTGSGSQSGPIPTVGASGAPEKKSGKGALVAILGVAAAVAVGAFFLTRGSGTDAGTAAPPASTPAKVDPPPASTTVAPTADPAAEAAKTVAAQKIVVRVESDPSGATVRRDNRDGEELCRDTPCDLIFKGSDATPGKDIKIHVTKKGFSGESKTIHIGSEDKVSVRLSSQGGGGGVAKPPPGGGGEGTGFKPVPY
jgi:serine/threonine-protein kinase